jgi:phage baseplate assembly protein W
MANNLNQPTSLGRSLRLTDGDLPFDQGDLAMIAGHENLLQAMQIMIQTPFGSDIFNVNYGFDLLSILSTPQTAGFIKSLIRLNIVKSVSQDNRVRQIKEVVFDDEPRFFEILPDQNADEHRRTRKGVRRWETVVVLGTISDGDVALQLKGTGLKT